jgi:hypothetical protein
MKEIPEITCSIVFSALVIFWIFDRGSYLWQWRRLDTLAGYTMKVLSGQE